MVSRWGCKMVLYSPRRRPAKGPCMGGSNDGSALSVAGWCFEDLGGPLYESLQQLVWNWHSKTLTTAIDFHCHWGITRGPFHRTVPLAEGTPTCLELHVWICQDLYVAADWSPKKVSGVTSGTGGSDVWVLRKGTYFGVRRTFGCKRCWLQRWRNQTCKAFQLGLHCGSITSRSRDAGHDCVLYWWLPSLCQQFWRLSSPLESQILGRPPRVLVADDDWADVVQGLINTGICEVFAQRLLYHVCDRPLLHGLFAVSKNEYDPSGVELHRLIMNMVPLNRLCRSLRGDVGTLPTMAGLSAFYLEDHEVAIMLARMWNASTTCFVFPWNGESLWVLLGWYPSPVCQRAGRERHVISLHGCSLWDF